MTNQTSGYSFSSINSENVTLKIDAASKDDVKYTVQLTIDYKINGVSKTASTSHDFTAKANSSCLLFSAKILMADGSYKNAGDIRPGDLVMSFNHETGRLDANEIIYNIHTDEEKALYEVLHLSFSDNIEIEVVSEHAFFDLTLNEYVYLKAENYEDYIGHQFAIVKEGELSCVKLEAGFVNLEITQICSPVSLKHFNVISNHLLGIAGGAKLSLFNCFKYDRSTLKYDENDKKQSIEKYGLLSKEEFENLYPKYGFAYDIMFVDRLNIAIGKGLLTWSEFDSYMNRD